MLVTLAPEPFKVPMKLVADTFRPVKSPEASRRTSVLAPLSDAPVVRALAIVPEDMASAFKEVRDAPEPLKVAVIVPAENSPLAPRATIVEAPLDEDAVVLALATVPLDIFEPLIDVTAEPSPLNVAVIVPAENSPLAPRATIVEAPLAEAAVVLALAIVPLDILFALILVTFAPEPLSVPIKLVAETFRPVKSPLASRRTSVLAPFDAEPVVRAFAIVPADMASAFKEVNEAPDPENDVPVIAPAANSPLAPRRTNVAAPLDAEPVVLALAIVPLDMFEALSAVSPEPSPLTFDAVIAPAENSPDAPRDTIVLAPLELEAVVRAFAIVPVLMFEAFKLVIFSPLNVAELDPVPP